MSGGERQVSSNAAGSRHSARPTGGPRYKVGQGSSVPSQPPQGDSPLGAERRPDKLRCGPSSAGSSSGAQGQPSAQDDPLGQHYLQAVLASHHAALSVAAILGSGRPTDPLVVISPEEAPVQLIRCSPRPAKRSGQPPHPTGTSSCRARQGLHRPEHGCHLRLRWPGWPLHDDRPGGSGAAYPASIV
ncbi:hypothetical protein NDU88_006788 [Pleurodeles waltl]|uniref:Uncharacterized protein n=1 Tax=Pleurodeles waltl TaxID=8319 RepID=A0AAV7UNK3_PLEWA|nr:hypothetical protein NDU88_006788 [Pleurodeles waltl]